MPGYVELLSIAALSLSIVLVWSRYNRAWLISYAVFLISGLYSSWIAPISIVSLIIFALVIRASISSIDGYKRYIINALVIICALASGVHLVPGFENIHLLEDTRLSDNTGWSSLRFSADKVSFGLFLLVAYRDRLCSSVEQLKDALVKGVPIIVMGLAVVYGAGLALEFVTLDITIATVVIAWFIRNLLFTVIAEEMFFRGFIQHKLENSLRFKNTPLVALIIASVLFGSVHLYGGWEYGLLATLAGLMYGFVYQKTKRIELAIIGHVALNTGHVLFLSYP